MTPLVFLVLAAAQAFAADPVAPPLPSDVGVAAPLQSLDDPPEDPEAVYQQAKQLLDGEGATQTFGAAMMQVAADQGHVKAQSIVGFMMCQSGGKDMSPGIEYLGKAAASGDPFAAKNLRRLHFSLLQDRPEQKARVAALLAAAAGAGAVPASLEYGSMAYFGEETGKEDHEKARRVLAPAAAAGDTEALNLLGVMYSKGYGGSQDERNAFEFFKIAAEAGHAKAQASTGLALAKGTGVQPDLVEAFKWFQLSSRQNEPLGANALKDFIRGLTNEQILEGNRRVAAFLQARGEIITAEQLNEEIFNPKVPTLEELQKELEANNKSENP